MNVIQIIVETPKAVALTPSRLHGEITANPKPVPRIISTSDIAAAAAPPARMAPHETALGGALPAASPNCVTGSRTVVAITPPNVDIATRRANAICVPYAPVTPVRVRWPRLRRASPRRLECEDSPDDRDAVNGTNGTLLFVRLVVAGVALATSAAVLFAVGAIAIAKAHGLTLVDVLTAPIALIVYGGPPLLAAGARDTRADRRGGRDRGGASRDARGGARRTRRRTLALLVLANERQRRTDDAAAWYAVRRLAADTRWHRTLASRESRRR